MCKQSKNKEFYIGDMDSIRSILHLVQSIGSFTLQKVQKSLYLAGIFYQAYY
jgi:Rps23 Pro-64 3,4-dihydroxylase Tpa1-like proline 4-hydroxylase